MRGLMFNHLLECIESHHSYDIVDSIIDASDVQDQGSYADGGMYEDVDFIKLIAASSKTLRVSESELLRFCGRQIFPFLYKRLLTIYDQSTYSTDSIKNAFDLISILETIHYKEVVKLYPDSIFPHFDVIDRDHSKLEILYRSSRNLSFLAKGMLEGCIEYFNEALTVEMQHKSINEGTLFIIRKEQA